MPIRNTSGIKKEIDTNAAAIIIPGKNIIQKKAALMLNQIRYAGLIIA